MRDTMSVAKQVSPLVQTHYLATLEAALSRRDEANPQKIVPEIRGHMETRPAG